MKERERLRSQNQKEFLFFFSPFLHSLDLRKKLKALTKLKLLRRIRYRFLYPLLETGISTNPLNLTEKIKGAREDKDRSCQTRYSVCRRAARSLTLIFFSLFLAYWTAGRNKSFHSIYPLGPLSIFTDIQCVYKKEVNQ